MGSDSRTFRTILPLIRQTKTVAAMTKHNQYLNGDEATMGSDSQRSARYDFDLNNENCLHTSDDKVQHLNGTVTIPRWLLTF
jgi:hypothetical protein